MRRLTPDEADRAVIVPKYLATMSGAGLFGVTRLFEMLSDFGYLGLYIMIVGCAAMTLPERSMWRTRYGLINVLLAATLFCLLAIPGRPRDFAGVSGGSGFLLLLISAAAVYASLMLAFRFVVRSRLITNNNP